MNPIDYTTQVQNPLNTAFQGFKIGAGIKQHEQQQEAIVKKQKEQEQMQIDLAALSSNENAGARDYQELMFKYPTMSEKLKEGFDFLDEDKRTKTFDTLTKSFAALEAGNTQYVQDILDERFAAAKKSGDVKEAASTKALMKVLSANPKNAKDTIGIMLASTMGKEKFMENMSKIADINKTEAETATIDATRSGEVDLNIAKSENERAQAGSSNADATKTGAETSTINATRDSDVDLVNAKAEKERATAGKETDIGFKNRSEGDQVNELTKFKSDKYVAETEESNAKGERTRRLLAGELDQQLLEQGKTKNEILKLKFEAKQEEKEFNKVDSGAIELTKDGEKLLNESVQTSIKSRQTATQYESLASEIDAEITRAGVAGKATESIKRIFGDEDNITALRQDYRRLRNTQVLDNLPPGVASDKDIEIAMSAFPDDTANPQLISQFMKGMAKLQRYDAAVNSAKGEWVNNVGNLGSARNGVKIGGVSVPSGTTFQQFAKTQTQLEQIEQNRKAKGLPDLTADQYQNFMRDALPKKKDSGRPVSKGRLVNHVKETEKFTPEAFWDHKQWTNGYGTKAKFKGEVIDEQEAIKRFDKHISKDKRKVENFVPKDTPEGIKDALTSLSFNAGSGWMQSGLGKAVKAKEWEKAKTIFLRYNKASGKVNRGLVSRRKKEAQWFG